MNKIKVKSYLKSLFGVLYALMIIYTVVSIIYTTGQVFNKKFYMDLFGFRFQITNVYISPLAEEY